MKKRNSEATEQMKSKKILLVAGEVSGDLHGSHLVEAIQRIAPEVRFFGVGGEGLKERGMKLLYPASSLSVVGITEVFLKLGAVLKALRGLKRSFKKEKPDLVILIDFPEFNLRLAKLAHRRGIPILYYIGPQIWAWRPKRVNLIARLVKKMIVLFPFEVPLYEAAGVDVEWVGHPLLDIVKPTLPKDVAFQQLGLDPKRRTVGLLPGSRVHEVERLLPPLLDSAHLLQREIPDLQFVIPLAPGLPRGMFSPWMKGISIPVKVVEGFAYDAMNASELLITASGTATLEGAILGKPMIIIYRVSLPSYWVGRALIRVDHIGLVNLVAEKEIAPELIQKDVNPQRIADEALRILRDPILSRKMSASMDEVRRKLGEPGAAQRAAQIVVSLMHEQQV
ncbi:MAG TPA: lipid-A-disaccharide synthase [Thermodesulfobacteriota bacterium]|jgi:lipid-A-disaccharide synthase|nr:lipid-A-disaccharide synthase [Thermodesulfobacteriota bacterium]